MVYLVVVVYPDQYRAAEIIATVQRLRRGEAPELGNPVSIINDAQGNLHLNRCREIPSDGPWASDFSIAIAESLMGLLGRRTIAGGRAHCVAFLRALGVSDWFMDQTRFVITANRSAIMLVVRDPETDDTLMEISKFGGIVLQTALAADAARRLRASFDARSC